MRRDQEERPPLVDHGAPRGERRRCPQAEEGQARLGDHRAGHAEGRLHEEDGGGERQQVARDDAARSRAERLRRLHELALPERRHLDARQARVARPAEQAERQDDVPEARPEDGGERDGEQEPREGEQHVDHARHRLVEPPAQIAGGGADRRADEQREHDDADAHGERDARTVQHAREHVAPEAVLAERVAGVRRGEPRAEVGRVGIGGEEGRGSAREREQQERRRPGNHPAPAPSAHHGAAGRSRGGAGPSPC